MKFYNRIISVGRKRTGKTYWVKHGFVKFLKRYIIYDPDKHFTKYGTVVNTLKEFRKIVFKQDKIIFQPRDSMIADFDAGKSEFNKLAGLVNQLYRTTFIIDEIASVTLKPGSRAANCPGNLRVTIRRREKPPHRIGVVCTAQHLKDSDVEYLSQADYLIVFDCYKVDMDYIKEKLDIDIRLIMEKVNIKKHEFIFYDHVGKKLYISRL